MVRVEISKAEWSPDCGSYVVTLTEAGGERYYPLFLDEYETESIALYLKEKGQKPFRSDDLVVALLDKLKARISQVEICRNLFRDIVAKIIIRHSGRQSVVAHAPGAALVLAVRGKIPIFIRESLLMCEGVGREKGCDKESKLEELKERLQEAISVEAYEEAARLRDEILKLEKNKKSV